MNYHSYSSNNIKKNLDICIMYINISNKINYAQLNLLLQIKFIKLFY
ncbi:hypothetical protein pb186bvf_000353 [Paramecium bursaria]